MNSESIKGLNYTNVTISNEALNDSRKNNQLHRQINPIQTKVNLNKNKYGAKQKLMYEKSTNKGSNTNLNRIIRNKNLNHQSNSSLNKIQNTIQTTADSDVKIPRTRPNNSFRPKHKQAQKSNTRGQISASNQSLNKIRQKSLSSQGLNQVLQKSTSNQCLIRSKSTSNLENKKFSSDSSLNQKTKTKLNKNPTKSISNLSTSSKINSSLYESIDYSVKIPNESNKKAFQDENAFSFSSIWNNQKFLYYNIQEIMFSLNIISTLIFFSLSIWINVDERFKIVTSLSNNLIYSSFNRLIGILPFICLTISCMTLLIDLSNLVLHNYVKRFLNNHDDKLIKKILINQKILAKMSEDTVSNKLKSLKLRSKIIFTKRSTLRSIRVLTYMNSSIYILIIAAIFFIGIYLHFLSDQIINFQLSQTLVKLIREYEKQQLLILNQLNEIQMKIKNVAIGTIEENLINKLNLKFQCCHYTNPFQYGELVPPSCIFNNGCLRPLQEFLWEYLYYSVIAFLALASFKTCTLFVSLFNFRVILVSRLFKKLYEVDIRKYRLIYQELLNFPEDLQIAEEEDDEFKRKEKFAKLQEIREKKFEQLQKEEEEELLRKEREETELNEFLENEKRQEAYEKILIKQKRWDEYNYQQLQRKIQLQHFLDRNSDNN